MAEYILKYADGRGAIHQQVADAESEQELRERLTQQGYLIYSIKPRAGALVEAGFGKRRKKLDMEKFLIFNQQFVTLIRAGLPILKSLDLLGDRLTDPKLGPYVKAVRDEVRNGVLLSEAFRRQRIFPGIYVTSVMAGEKSGALGEVLERYINYQRLALALKKKLLVSLMYPALLFVLVIALIVFLITWVVPRFGQLYSGMSAGLPYITQMLIAAGTTARNYILLAVGVIAAAVVLFRIWARTEKGQSWVDRIRLRMPLFGEIWIKYQVAQLSRVLSTLLIGGIPLVQALETAADSLGAQILRESVGQAQKRVKEGQALSSSLQATGIFPGLAIDMIEVGESTGALPAMLNSVAEFYEDDVNTRLTAVLALIEPFMMLFMGTFVAFVLVALYLPIFSLADTLR